MTIKEKIEDYLLETTFAEKPTTNKTNLIVLLTLVRGYKPTKMTKLKWKDLEGFSWLTRVYLKNIRKAVNDSLDDYIITPSHAKNYTRDLNDVSFTMDDVRNQFIKDVYELEPNHDTVIGLKNYLNKPTTKVIYEILGCERVEKKRDIKHLLNKL